MKKSLEERFWSKVEKGDGCWEWAACKNSTGYGRFRVNGHTEFAHRVSWTLAHGPIPDGLFVCHHCDNPSCVRSDHLFIGSHKDNLRDAVKKGRTATGDRNGSYTHPERRPTGDRNGMRIHPERHISRLCPEKLARGDRNGSRTHPESRPRGNRHGFRLHPESVPRGDRHGSRIHPERLVRGEKQWKAKLKTQDVLQIRELYATGTVSQRKLARFFGVSHQTIGRVIHRKNWAHV